MDAPKRIAQLVQEACIREVCALKPGNVNRKHDFSDTTFEDFLLSAVAIGPAFENAGIAGVGQIVLQATLDRRSRVRSNTNLGIVLLLAPLAKACLAVSGNPASGALAGAGPTRRGLRVVLNTLTVEDARLVYASVRAANPRGLGRVSRQDITGEPSVTLLEAMRLAKDRDSIALEYVTDFEITFVTGLPALREALRQGADFSDAVVQTFLAILSQVPDTLITRKKGVEVSLQVSRWAREVLLEGGALTPRGKARLQKLDSKLRDESHKLNPGTTADLTAAVVFLALLEAEAGFVLTKRTHRYIDREPG